MDFDDEDELKDKLIMYTNNFLHYLDQTIGRAVRFQSTITDVGFNDFYYQKSKTSFEKDWIKNGF